MINRKERFAMRGFRIQRNNPDGTIPTPARFLGFANTVDISGVVTAGSTASMTIKVDANPAETLSVDFSTVMDLSRVTVQQAVTALTTAAFDGATWSVDPITGRLMGRMSGNGKIIQVVGKLAAAMDFGQCIAHGGMGLEVISFFNDETINIGLPKSIKDKEEIDIEGANGTITRMVIGAMIQGINPVITLKEKDYNLIELIQGGLFDREANSYDPPLSHESEHPVFHAEVYSPVYGSGSNKQSDIAGYEKLLFRTMIGMEGDVPIEAKSWAQYAYNCSATEYRDENGKKFAAWQEATLTPEAFDSLRVDELEVL